MSEQLLLRPTVFVVDDDADLRQTLEVLITGMGHRVRTFDSAAQLRNYYQVHMPGCLLLDIRMPRQTGLQLYQQLLQEGKRLPVIFITAHADVSTAVAAMKTGAIDLLEKPLERATLEDRLEKALTLDARWRKQAARLADMDQRIGSLTRRERETLQLILDGCSNKVMAARQRVTQRAIEMRRARIMQKLGVRSLPELLNVAVTHRVMREVRDLHGEHHLFH